MRSQKRFRTPPRSSRRSSGTSGDKCHPGAHRQLTQNISAASSASTRKDKEGGLGQASELAGSEVPKAAIERFLTDAEVEAVVADWFVWEMGKCGSRERRQVVVAEAVYRIIERLRDPSWGSLSVASESPLSPAVSLVVGGTANWRNSGDALTVIPKPGRHVDSVTPSTVIPAATGEPGA